MMKFSAASPQYSLSHGILASKPPEAPTKVLAVTSRVWPWRSTTAERNTPSSMLRSRTSVSYSTRTPIFSAVS